MHERTKELIKQLVAELEMETIPALKASDTINAMELVDEFKAIQKDLKELYTRLNKA